MLGAYGAGTTVTGSKVANVDYPGEHLHVSLVGGSAAGSALLYRELSPTSQPATAWAAGDKVYAQIELEFTSGAITNIEYGVDCRINAGGTTPAQFYGMFHESQNPNLSYTPQGRLTFRTPTFTIPTGVDRLRMLVRVTGANGEFDIYLADLRKA